ncbi:MAG TPA: hypothetical protein VL418_18375 [Devosiaceae bacterium]|nr:hypothetical protein [Devosiaceae bacterium]
MLASLDPAQQRADIETANAAITASQVQVQQTSAACLGFVQQQIFPSGRSLPALWASWSGQVIESTEIPPSRE